MKYTLFLIITICIFSSCKKYEEGPRFALTSKKARLNSATEIAFYSVNGKDVTSQFSKAKMEFSTNFYNSIYIRTDSITGKPLGYRTKTGTWTLSNNKYHVHVVESYGVYDLADKYISSGLSDITYTIVKLKHNDVWLRSDDAPQQIIIHLK
jgi:hypothetical protein